MKSISYSNVEKNVYKILLTINENGLEDVNYTEVKDVFNLNQKEFERAMCFIKHEGLLISYEDDWYEDILGDFSCCGLSKNGFDYLRENSFIGKACGFINGLKEWI